MYNILESASYEKLIQYRKDHVESIRALETFSKMVKEKFAGIYGDTILRVKIETADSEKIILLINDEILRRHDLIGNECIKIC